uniref:Uncharacterized protein n=1 Tax=Oryza glumipatula TaxID=40148 RepID=A0A0E0BMK5_9ORYZ
MPRARLHGAASPSNMVAYTASTEPPCGSSGTSGAILATSLGSSVASSSTPAPSCSATVKVTASSGWSGGDEGRAAVEVLLVAVEMAAEGLIASVEATAEEV